MRRRSETLRERLETVKAMDERRSASKIRRPDCVRSDEQKRRKANPALPALCACDYIPKTCMTRSATVSTVTIATVAHITALPTHVLTNLPMIRLSAAIRAMNTSSTGRITPSDELGGEHDAHKIQVRNENHHGGKHDDRCEDALEHGASFQVKSMPASQPNASQMTNDVVSGSTQAAKSSPPSNPPRTESAHTGPRTGQARWRLRLRSRRRCPAVQAPRPSR